MTFRKPPECRTTMRMLTLIACLMLFLSFPATANAQDRCNESEIRIEQGHSVICDRGRTIKQIILSNQDVLSVESLSMTQFQMKGLSVGTTNLWVVYADTPNRPVEYEVIVHQDLSQLIRRIDRIVGDSGSVPTAYPLNGHLIIEGAVPSVVVLEQIAEVARLYDEEFVNLMTVGGDHQVQLQVVFAEVNRSGLRQMGLNALYGENVFGIGLLPPGQIVSAFAQSSVTSINNGVVGSPSADSFNLLGVFGSPVNVTAILGVLEQNGISKTLAQPSLTALSGQEAEFLAGGEIPIPVAQNGARISIEFKEYGVRMTFVPTVLGDDVIDVRVYIEVSDIDSNNAIRLTGVEIPAFVSRKSSSHLRIESGKTFAMAGMLQDTTRQITQKVPFLGDIPLLGALFRTVDHERDEVELMIFITPRLVRPMSPEDVPAMPGTTENNNPNDFELFLLGLDHQVGSRTAEPTGPIGLER
jgi:pilus assembly protein CpaC